MAPAAANELLQNRRVQLVTDSQPTFRHLTFSSMLTINPTYSAHPVFLHHKLTFFSSSLPLSVLLYLFPFTRPPLPPPSCSKLIRVKIIDDEEYEKNKNFFLELAEPRMVDMSLQKGAVANLFLSL